MGEQRRWGDVLEVATGVVGSGVVRMCRRPRPGDPGPAIIASRVAARVVREAPRAANV
jgi:hypothetical protein